MESIRSINSNGRSYWNSIQTKRGQNEWIANYQIYHNVKLHHTKRRITITITIFAWHFKRSEIEKDSLWSHQTEQNCSPIICRVDGRLRENKKKCGRMFILREVRMTFLNFVIFLASFKLDDWEKLPQRFFPLLLHFYRSLKFIKLPIQLKLWRKINEKVYDH